jgi:CRP-like cAMP-binding protein
MAVDAQILESLNSMSDLTAIELAQVAALANRLPVIEGEVLAPSGAPARTLFITLSGSFMVVFEEERALTGHTPGDLLGISSVLSPFLYKGTTTGLTNGEVLALPGEDLRDLIQKQTPLGEKIMSRINAILAERSAIQGGI